MKRIGFHNQNALRLFLGHYIKSDTFMADVTGLIPLLPKNVYRGDNRPAAVFLLNSQPVYDYACEGLVQLWAKNKHRCSANLLNCIDSLAEKWGLRSPWGKGFILETAFGVEVGVPIAAFLPLLITKFPQPKGMKAYHTLEVDPLDSNRSLRQKAQTLSREAMLQRKLWQNYLRQSGFDTHIKSSFGEAAKWLFWRITPPYLSPAEISCHTGKDETHIKREYQRVAKMIELSLNRGWTKGRRRSRAVTSRAFMRHTDEISALFPKKSNHV